MGIYQAGQYSGILGIDNFIFLIYRIIMVSRKFLNFITRNNYPHIMHGLSPLTIVKKMPPSITISKIFS